MANGANPNQHGIRVLNDKLNRWASSRPMWNQHAYSVTNINDDGTIPKTSDWIAKQNFKTPGLNNYRQNVQGPTTVDELPDITGRIDKDACQLNGNSATLTVNICNRGKRAVPAAVPGTAGASPSAPRSRQPAAGGWPHHHTSGQISMPAPVARAS